MTFKSVFLILVFTLIGYTQEIDTLPKFELETYEGQTFSTESVKSKVVVVDFWAIWCVTCREVFPVLNELRKAYPPEQLAILGVSIDKAPKSKFKKFLKRYPLEYQILLDPDQTLEKPFQIKSVPTLFIFDQDSKKVLSLRNYDPGHIPKIKAAVDSLLTKTK